MISDNDEEQEYVIWRLMIAEPFQGRGYGGQAIQRLVEYVTTRPGATELLVSCGQGEGSPELFYEKLGFVHTGDQWGREVVLRLELPRATES
jgi:diamine N-acetyltransferase